MVQTKLFDNDVQSLAICKGDVLVGKGKRNMFEILRFQRAKMESRYRDSALNLSQSVTDFDDLLVIDNMLLASVICNDNQYYVLKIAVGTMKLESSAVYYKDTSQAKYKMRISKSLLAYVLVILNNLMFHLSESCDVMKKINLPFVVYDGVQLDLKNYAVCCQAEICIIDEKGNKLIRYVANDEGHRVILPRALTKDSYGNIYVYESSTNKIFILGDVNLNLKSSFDLKRGLLKILCDDTNNVLMVLQGQI